jgi:hypothetical protein
LQRWTRAPAAHASPHVRCHKQAGTRAADNVAAGRPAVRAGDPPVLFVDGTGNDLEAADIKQARTRRAPWRRAVRCAMRAHCRP